MRGYVSNLRKALVAAGLGPDTDRVPGSGLRAAGRPGGRSTCTCSTLLVDGAGRGRGARRSARGAPTAHPRGRPLRRSSARGAGRGARPRRGDGPLRGASGRGGRGADRGAPRPRGACPAAGRAGLGDRPSAVPGAAAGPAGPGALPSRPAGGGAAVDQRGAPPAGRRRRGRARSRAASSWRRRSSPTTRRRWRGCRRRRPPDRRDPRPTGRPWRSSRTRNGSAAPARRPGRGRCSTGWPSRGGVLVVSGEAGIGKSTLLRGLRAEALRRGFVVGWDRCPESAAGAPYRSWRVGGGAAVARRVDPHRRPALDQARAEQEAAGALLATHLGELDRLRARTEPAVLVIDDLQWADDATLVAARVPRSRARAPADPRRGRGAARRIGRDWPPPCATAWWSWRARPIRCTSR